MIRVVVVEDEPLLRSGLIALAQRDGDIEVVAEAAQGGAALARVRERRPDVVLMDIQMPGLDGIEATRALLDASPGTRVLIVTTFARPGYLRGALDAGASGFVVKDSPAAQLADAVRQVHAGQRVVDPTLAEATLFEGASPLSDRERQVLRLSADGRSASTIAAEVFLSPGTVRNHLSSAIGKTGAENRAQAARIARDKGWL